MDVAANFYLKLGFTQIVDTPHYTSFSFPDGNSTFSLPLESSEFENSSVIYFEHEKLDELCTELTKKGFQFEQQPIEQRYLWKEAILKDPPGNKIQLYWAGENLLKFSLES